MSDDARYSQRIQRPDWFYPFPVAVIVVTIAVAYWTDLPHVLETGYVLLVAWLAFSTASGAYPWSMRP